MYHPTTRLLTILELLQMRPVWGGTELAERLEVEPRTVRRYITMLQDMGMPVEPVRGPGGGYRLRPGFKLPPLLFTEEEATAIVISLVSMASQQLEDAAVPVEGALAKVLRVLPIRGRERLNAVTTNLSLSKPDKPTRLNAALLVDLSDAAQRRQLVHMSYTAENGRATERTVSPYGLAGWWGDWYLVGFCHLRNDIRTFRLDRIGHLQILEGTFDRPDDFDCRAYVVHHIGRATARYDLRIEVRAPLAVVQSKIPADYGQLTELPSGTLFESKHGNLKSVALFLISLELPFVVHHPPELREIIVKLADQLYASTAA